MVETHARALIEVLRGIPKDRHMCVEEGTLSGWLHEVLEPHVQGNRLPSWRRARHPRGVRHRPTASRGACLATLVRTDYPTRSRRCPRCLAKKHLMLARFEIDNCDVAVDHAVNTTTLVGNEEEDTSTVGESVRRSVSSLTSHGIKGRHRFEGTPIRSKPDEPVPARCVDVAVRPLAVTLEWNELGVPT